MANYAMTPYAFWLHPRNARGGERRPIDNVDGNGATVREVIEAKLQEYVGDDLIVDQEDDSKSLRVVRLYPYAEFTFVEFGVGRAGYVGTLHQRGGGRVGYTADEHNENLIRAIFVFPPGGHEVYWLNERAGLVTAYSYMDEILTDALRVRFSAFTVNLEPVADWAAVQQWAQNVLVQEIRFDAPHAGGSTQAIDVNGIHADIRVVVKPRGLPLSRVVDNNGPNQSDIFGFLSGAAGPLARGGGVSASNLIGHGWSAKVAFKNPAGRQRSFGVQTDERGPTLVYPVGSLSAGRSRAYRPDDSEFASACGDFLGDVVGRLPIGATVAGAIVSTIT